MEQTAVQTHTPGPWKVLPMRHLHTFKVSTDQGASVQAVIAAMDTKSVMVNEAAQEANARLIAAAPELLEALELAHKALSEESRYAQSTTANKIRAAIRKATGE
jgi:hypothetical protein